MLRSFAQARPFIFVDPDELKHTQSWITNKQLVNGCFPKYGRLFNKRLKVSPLPSYFVIDLNLVDRHSSIFHLTKGNPIV